MLTAALIVAIVGWLLAAAMWCWACAEQNAKEREVKRADRAVWFAEDCLEDLRGRDALLDSYRRNTTRLIDHIRDLRAEATYVSETPVFDATAAHIAHEAAAQIDIEWFDLSEGER